jgi:hypothetical protein
MNIVIGIQLILLFVNCILTIDMYNESNCKNETVTCNSYILPNQITKSTINPGSNTINNIDIYHGTINDIDNPVVKCGQFDYKSPENNQIKLIISIFILIGALGLGGLGTISSDINDGSTSNIIINILLTIANIVVSSFNFTIYDKCLGDIFCDNKKAEYVKGMGISVSCFHEIEKYNSTKVMYIIMIILLSISIILSIYNVVSLSGHGFGGSSFL